MGQLKRFIIPFILFIVLDAFWLGYVTKDIYVTELGPIARLKDGSLDVVYWAAFLVYIFLGLGVSQFVLDFKKADISLARVFVRGGLFGLLTYGVYDMTNVSTLKDFTVKIALMDLAWGATVCALVSAVTYLILRNELKNGADL